MESSLKNRESVVPPTALLRIVTSDCKKPRREKGPSSPRPGDDPHQIPHRKVQEYCHREMQEPILPGNFATKHGGPSKSTKF